MRWIQHWIIGKECLKGRKSLAYQLGCVLPDWFDTHPIHRIKESFSHFLNDAEKTRHLSPGPYRDWKMGNLAHLLCDYCTMAHNDEYYRFYRHRVYEVMAQKRFQRERDKGNNCLIAEKDIPIPPALLESTTSAARFKESLSSFILHFIDELHREIDKLESQCWFRDERIAECDTRYAYLLLNALLKILGEEELFKGGE